MLELTETCTVVDSLVVLVASSPLGEAGCDAATDRALEEGLRPLDQC